jgi:3'-5' exoribonuclease
MSVKTQWVKTIRPGMDVSTYFGVFDLNIGTNKHGGKFLKILLGDRTGTVEGRVWDSALAEDIYHTIAPGDIVIVQGVATEFNGIQIDLDSCTKVDKELVELNDFRPVTDKEIPLLIRQFTQELEKVTTPALQTLLTRIFNPSFLSRFSRATAARTIHHAYSGGLLEHTIEVISYCMQVCKIHEEQISHDLLITGAALHDIGKLWEYDQNGLTFQRTKEGRLLGGHVILGYNFVCDQIKELKDFPTQIALHLKHLILSHHGHKEWGAVEEPHTLEAVALHHADLMSARLNQVEQVIKSYHGDDNWTNYDRHLGKSIYVPEKE